MAKAYFHFHNYFAKQTRIHEEDGETSEDVFPENGRSGKAGIELQGSFDDLVPPGTADAESIKLLG